VQSPYVGFLIRDVPWAAVRRVRGASMLDVDLYYVYWMAETITPLLGLDSETPLGQFMDLIITARITLKGFQSYEALAAALPRTTQAAADLLVAIDRSLPINPETDATPFRDLTQPISKYGIEDIKNDVISFSAALRGESQHSYILKVQDQRCLSSYSLMEKMEECFSREVWSVIGEDGKKEFGECGKCLALERYTSAGFHALRGVECVIRQLLNEYHALPSKRDWGSYVDAMKKVGIDSKVTSVIDNIRALERNPLMHPEDWLDVDESIGIFTISNTAISRLAGEIKKKQAAKAATP